MTADKRTFVLRNAQIQSHCAAFIASLGVFGKVWEITIKPYVRNRSRAQERLFHAWVDVMAQSKGYTPPHMKILIKHHLGLFEYVMNKKTGEVIPSLRSTTDLNVHEYADLITQTEILAAKDGILLPRDHDYYEAIGVNEDAPVDINRKQNRIITHAARA